MNDQNLHNRILTCLKKIRPLDREIKPESLFKEDLGFESIDVVDLLFELESEFAKPFPMKEFNHYVVSHSHTKTWDFTLKMLVDFVAGKAKAG